MNCGGKFYDATGVGCRAVNRGHNLLWRCNRFLLKAGLSVVLLSSVALVTLRWVTPPVSSFMLQRCLADWWHGRGCSIHYQWATWETISPFLKLAVVAAEDQNFPHHFGFDVSAMLAAWRAHQGGKRLRGASTISQQVAKNLFLWPGRSFVRKTIEAYVTLMIELLWPKRRILEVYLNIVEFGRGRFGVVAASRLFFAKPPDRLTAPEAALLAAVLPNPSQFRVEHPSVHVVRRQQWILRQMRQLGGTAYLGGL